MQYNIERRFVTGLEETGGKLVGYAAVFNSPSQDLGGFVEVIRPGAFTRTLQDNPDILALVDHDSAKVLGRTKAGTLTLVEDSRGLRVEIDLPDTTVARDIRELIRRGDVSGMSFAFRVHKQRIDLTGPIPTRHLIEVELREVSIVTFPAYPDTSVAVRAVQAVEPDFRRLRLELAERQN